MKIYYFSLVFTLIICLVVFIRNRYQRGITKKKVALYEIKDNKVAIADFNKMLEVNNRFVNSYSTRLNMKDNLGAYHGSIANFSKTLDIEPEEAKAYFMRGLVEFFILNDFRSAILDYNRAIKLNPLLDIIYCNRGITKVNLSDYYGAIADYSKAIEIDREYSFVYYLRGLTNLKLKNKKEACIDWSKAAELGYHEAYDLLKKYCK